jgi:hypothetical protein
MLARSRPELRPPPSMDADHRGHPHVGLERKDRVHSRNQDIVAHQGAPGKEPA